MKIPSRIRVVNRTFAVRLMDNEAVRCSGSDGICDPIDDNIYLNTDQSESQVLETLLHEVGHAINVIVGINDDSTEEDFIRRSTPIWMSVWRDNPDLFSLIKEWVGD